MDTDANNVSDHDELMFYAYAGPYFADEAALDTALGAALGSSPLGSLDWDRDGMTNVWEMAHGLNPADTLDAYEDPDGDFLVNREEYHARSDPNMALSLAAQSVTIQAMNPTTQQMETRAAINDYEAVMGLPLPVGLVRENGPVSGYDYDDDWDGDGYRNLDEILAVPARDPRVVEITDGDGDGLPDLWEIQWGLDETNADQDSDSLNDGEDDFDNDQLTNYAEWYVGTNPLLADTDMDTLPDGWEWAKGLNALSADQDEDNLSDEADDFDNDQLTNLQELSAGTHPRLADTDNDGLPDGWELAHLLNPLSNVGIHGAAGDGDGDGFNNTAELAAGSSPQNSASTPPASYLFKDWFIHAEGGSDNAAEIVAKITSLQGSPRSRIFPNLKSEEDDDDYYTTGVRDALNAAADWAEPDMKGTAYAAPSVAPRVVYDPDLSEGGDLRFVGTEAEIVASRAEVVWHGNTFDVEYRRVRLEATQAVGATETRIYLVYTETEEAGSFQHVGQVTFTLQAGTTQALVSVPSELADHGLSVASDGKTLCMEPTIPNLLEDPDEDPDDPPALMKRCVYLKPLVAIEIKHTEIDPVTGNVVNPGVNTILRDEIVEIRIKSMPMGTTGWPVDLSVHPTAMRNQNLPNRGNVQMYDFGQVESNGYITPDITQFVLQSSSDGVKILKAVFNKVGKLNIKMTTTDGNLEFTSPEYTVKERIRKYATPFAGLPNHDPNKYDQEFIDAVTYWGSFYAHPIDTVERVKAMAVAESNVGGLVQNPSLRPHDVLTVGHPNDDMLETIQGNPSQWDLDLAHPKKPAADARYKKVSYPNANIESTREAIKWGVLWLYIKAFSHAPVEQPSLRTIKRNPVHTPALVWEKRNKPPYNVIEGEEEPEFQFDHWHDWDNATLFYNGGGDADNPTKIDHALRSGLHYYRGTTQPIWPIRTNKSARP